MNGIQHCLNPRYQVEIVLNLSTDNYLLNSVFLYQYHEADINKIFSVCNIPILEVLGMHGSSSRLRCLMPIFWWLSTVRGLIGLADIDKSKSLALKQIEGPEEGCWAVKKIIIFN